MKKILTVTVAASMALCATAAEGFLSGTSFEGLSGGSNLRKGANDAGEVYQDNVCYWSTDAWNTENHADYEGFFVVTNLSEDAVYAGDRPEQWAGTTPNNKALAIDTDKPLYRRINSIISEGYSPSKPLDANGVFFDSVVQFTATDAAPSISGDDRLLVWLYSSPEDVATTPGLFGEGTPMTSLVVTARYYEKIGEVSHELITNYCVTAEGVSVNPDEWHRLTIKAFVSDDDKEQALFNVFVDGKKVSAEGGKCDFISLKDGDSNIVGVAFDGKGMVDDIAFTTKDPFYVAPEEAEKVNVSVNINEYSAIAAAMFNEVQVDSGSVTIECDKDSTNTLMFMLKNDYELVSSSPEASFDDQIGIYTITVVPDSDMTVTIVVQPIAGGGEGGGTDEPGTDDPVPPTVGGVEIVVDGTTGKITNITTADNGKAVVGDLDTSMFADYYTVSVKDGVLSIALNPAVATPEINETATDEGDAIVVTDNAVALGVTNAKPGLWYGAQAYDDVACADGDKIGAVTGWVKATTTTVSVTAEKPTKKEGELTVVVDKAFFRVVVDDQDHTPPLAEQE